MCGRSGVSDREERANGGLAMEDADQGKHVPVLLTQCLGFSAPRHSLFYAPRHNLFSAPSVCSLHLQSVLCIVRLFSVLSQSFLCITSQLSAPSRSVLCTVSLFSESSQSVFCTITTCFLHRYSLFSASSQSVFCTITTCSLLRHSLFSALSVCSLLRHNLFSAPSQPVLCTVTLCSRQISNVGYAISFYAQPFWERVVVVVVTGRAILCPSVPTLCIMPCREVRVGWDWDRRKLEVW